MGLRTRNTGLDKHPKGQVGWTSSGELQASGPARRGQRWWAPRGPRCCGTDVARTWHTPFLCSGHCFSCRSPNLHLPCVLARARIFPSPWETKGLPEAGQRESLLTGMGCGQLSLPHDWGFVPEHRAPFLHPGACPHPRWQARCLRRPVQLRGISRRQKLVLQPAELYLLRS